MDNQIMTVSLKKIENMCTSLREYLKLEEDQDYEVGFEYVTASLFPGVFDNVTNELKRQYTLGFIEGTKYIEI